MYFSLIFASNGDDEKLMTKAKNMSLQSSSLVPLHTFRKQRPQWNSTCRMRVCVDGYRLIQGMPKLWIT
jgi:hypothetical protein